jgi:hypothetical protein
MTGTIASGTTQVNKVFRATLRDEPGTLTKLNGEILFFHDTGEIVSIDPEDCVWLCLLAEVGLSQAQELADQRHGGPIGLALTRRQEVA